MRFFIRERTVFCLVLAAVLTPLLLHVKGIDPIDQLDINRRTFFIRKVYFERDAEVLFVGHSRVMRGLSPDHFSEVLPGLVVKNYGFPNLQLTRDTLDDINALIAPGDGPRVLVLEYSPWVVPMIPPLAGRNQMIRQARGYSASTRWLMFEHPEFYARTQPIKLYQLWRWVIVGGKYKQNRARKAGLRYTIYHDNGWAERKGLYPVRGELADPYMAVPNDPRAINMICRQVREWRKRGIIVIGLRMPVDSEREHHEEARFATPMAELIQPFEAAGGRFVRIPNGAYRTHDGSHLTPEEAIRLSKDLARTIKPLIDRPRTGD